MESSTPRKNNSPQHLSTPIRIPATPFLKKIGYGTGVHICELHRSPRVGVPRSPWAVKKLNKKLNAAMKKQVERCILKEADILKNLDHENIIRFKGLSKSSDGKNCLVLEKCEKSLGDMIEDRLVEKLGPYPVDKILKVGLSIARALSYLHKEKRILHGDIKSHNILINGDFDAVKLCDFGVCCKLDKSDIAHGFVGTAVYSAPECQDDSNEPVTSKSDIFSFGLVLWEMLALTIPHAIDFDEECEDSYDEPVGIDESKFGTRPALPDIDFTEEYNPVLELFHVCTEQDPGNRPSPDNIIQYIEAVIANKI